MYHQDEWYDDDFCVCGELLNAGLCPACDGISYEWDWEFDQDEYESEETE